MSRFGNSTGQSQSGGVREKEGYIYSRTDYRMGVGLGVLGACVCTGVAAWLVSAGQPAHFAHIMGFMGTLGALTTYWGVSGLKELNQQNKAEAEQPSPSGPTMG